MKTKLLFTIACIFLLFQVFSSVPVEFNNESEMQSVSQSANGSMQTVKVHSQAIANNMLGDDEYRKVSVYLPPGYDEKAGINYPVIYFLSDANGTNEDWFHLSGERPLPEVLDKLIQSGNIKPMIMVFPDSKNKLGGSWYTNSTVSGNWEDFVVKDLVKYIDQNYSTLPFAASRGIAGKGMGGYGSLKLATKYPNVFSSVYSLNALIDFNTMINHEYLWKSSFKIAAQATRYPTSDEFANRLLGMAVAFSPDIFNPSCGKLPQTTNGEIIPDVYQLWLEQDPLYMIQGNLKNLKALKTITVDCSTSNAVIMLNSNYTDALKAKNITHTFTYFSGTDNNSLLKRLTNFLLPLFSNNLAQSILKIDADPICTYTDVIKAGIITDGIIYLVPAMTAANLQSIEKNKILKLEVNSKGNYIIPLDKLSKGIYHIYGLTNTGFLDKPWVFGLSEGTPQVKICVYDSYTGDKIKTCGVNVNGKCYTTGPDGELCFCGEGNTTICVQKENYSMIMKSALIYSDTTLYIPLVKDSYVQVVKKGNGMPIFEAMVTHDNEAHLTAGNGFATVHNLRDGKLDCRIFKTGYFTETLSRQLNPGETAVVELTPRKVDLTFILIGNQGHLADGSFKFGLLSIKPDENGRVRLTNIDARQEYSYRIDNASYETVQETIVPESDATIVIELQSKEVASLYLKSDEVITGTQNISESDILIYPNPATNVLTVQTSGNKGLTVELSDISGKLISKAMIEGTLHQINLSNLSKGVYFVTVKSDNFYHARKIIKL